MYFLTSDRSAIAASREDSVFCASILISDFDFINVRIPTTTKRLWFSSHTLRQNSTLFERFSRRTDSTAFMFIHQAPARLSSIRRALVRRAGEPRYFTRILARRRK